MIIALGMEIRCDFCKNKLVSRYSYDVHQLCAVAMENGWRQYGANDYCPECVKERDPEKDETEADPDNPSDPKLVN